MNLVLRRARLSGPVRSACPAGFAAPVLAAIVAISTLGASAPAHADRLANSWHQAGPFGADVQALERDPSKPNVVLAGTLTGGLYRSANGGLHWDRAATNLPNSPGGIGYPQVFAIAIDPGNSDNVLLSAAAGLYRSGDGGITVSALPAPPVLGGAFSQLLYIPGRSDEVFGSNAKFGGRVYRSIDSGESWTDYSDGLVGSLKIMAPDGTGLCAATNDGLYRRGAQGSWTRAGDLPVAGELTDMLVDQDGAILISSAEGCHYSTSGGASWEVLELNDIGPIFRFGVDASGKVFIAGRGRFAKIERDLQGSEVASSDFPFTPTTGLLVMGDNALLAGTAMGIFRSVDGGLSWEPSHEGIYNTDILPIVADANDPDYMLVAAGQTYDGGVYLTTDGGATWSQRGLRMPNTDVRALAINPFHRNVLLAGTGNRLDVDGQNGQIYRSDDAGLTWRDVTVGFPPDEARLVLDIQWDPRDANIVYACVVGVGNGFFKSYDGGETWHRRSVGLVSMPTMPGMGENPFLNYYAALSIAIDPNNPDRIYMGQGGCWGSINISTDAGETWTRKAFDTDTPGLPFGVGFEVFDVAIDPVHTSTIYAVGRFKGSMPGMPDYPATGVWKSTDAGNSWIPIDPRTTGSFLANGIAIDPRNPNSLYIATRKGIQHSVDGGLTYAAVNEGLSNHGLIGRSIFIHPLRPGRLVYGSALTGVWTRDIGAGTSVVLSRFTATPNPRGGVLLEWSTADESDHVGFHVYRAPVATGTASTQPVRISERLVTGGPDYSWFDGAVAPGSHDYWISDISRDGTATWHGPIRVEIASAPSAPFGLTAAPNPFAAATVLSFAQSVAGHAKVGIYDVAGRAVRGLLDGTLNAGRHDITWDGRDTSGAPVSGGIYYARIEGADGRVSTQKLTLAR